MLESLSTTTSSRDAKRAPTIRNHIFRFLETAGENDSASRIVDVFLIVLITASVLAVILESISAFEQRYGNALYWFEICTITIFSIEYLFRVWSCVEHNPGAARQPFRARLRFVFSFHAVIDLLAILPFYLMAFGAFSSVDMRFLRAIRLLRVLKLTRYFAALNMLMTAVQENGRALAAAFLILVTIMLLAASGMYYFERQSQPEDFGSIPAAMWWAFATLTTVGYGDVTPITVGGKIFGALITVVGIGMVALPTSILATGYSQQVNISAKAYRAQADRALDDGILSDDELHDLEKLRINLGLGKHTASQILDEGLVRSALHSDAKQIYCPHCNAALR